jgi:hypothetical protein
MKHSSPRTEDNIETKTEIETEIDIESQSTDLLIVDDVPDLFLIRLSYGRE